MMTNSKIVNKYYIETTFKIIPINKNNEIRIVTSKDNRINTLLVDIRKYSLYGNNYDNIKRATSKGIKFKLSNIKQIILGLLDICLKYELLSSEDYNTIHNILCK